MIGVTQLNSAMRDAAAAAAAAHRAAWKQNDLDRSAYGWAADVALMASSDLFLNPHYVASRPNHIEHASCFFFVFVFFLDEQETSNEFSDIALQI
jgi:hypothetical protein